MRKAERIAKAFEEIATACDTIKGYDRCNADGCPMFYMCLEDGEQSVIEMADLICADTWDEFLNYAYYCTPSEEMQADIDADRDYQEWKDREID